MIIFYICVALLPSIIHCSSDPPKLPEKVEDLKNILNDMANNNGTINDIFKPSKNGFLGTGLYGVTYKGTLLYPKNIDVAMKFTHNEEENAAVNEYSIYTYLHAIDDPRVESYGIPSVYYYGTWNEYIMMGITLLDPDFNEIYRAGDLNEVDLLILCKEFVRISKYMHSCGIYHDDIAARNIMFRNNNGFIIDFNRAKKMYIRNTTKLSASLKKAGIQFARNDWKAFLDFVCNYYGIDVELYEVETKKEIRDAMACIGERDDDISRVFVEMGNHIFGIEDKSKESDQTSTYDEIYKLIEGEIDDYGEGTPTLCHWLVGTEKGAEAIQEFESNPIRPISSIQDPLKLTEINYPTVDLEYFDKKIRQLKSQGSVSSEKSRKTFSSVGSSKFSSKGKKKK